jgi:hypothetical protein
VCTRFRGQKGRKGVALDQPDPIKRDVLRQRGRDATSGTNSPYGIRFWQCRITAALLRGITSPAGKARYLLYYCSTTQATKATTAIAAMRDKLSASVSTSFSWRNASSGPRVRKRWKQARTSRRRCLPLT